MKPGKRLSKSRVMDGLQCEKRLYLAVHHPYLATPASPARKHIFAIGTKIGEIARLSFPDGVLIESSYRKPDQALLETQTRIHEGRHVLFEPAFFFDNTFIRADILCKLQDDTWDLIEVKSTASPSTIHLSDLAVQRHVIEHTGLPIHSTILMLLNRSCTFPDLSDLFSFHDVTDRVGKILDTIPGILGRFNRLIERPSIPFAPIGRHCRTPYECPFIAHCWRKVKEPSIFSIPHLHPSRANDLIKRGFISLHDIPADYRFSAHQQRFVDLVKVDMPCVLWPAITDALCRLIYPLHFLIIHSRMDILPRLSGFHPFDRYPFHVSISTISLSTALAEYHYLHEDQSDPRPAIAKFLSTHLEPSGSILVFNAATQKHCLLALSRHLPGFSPVLSRIEDRLFDLVALLKATWFDYRLGKVIAVQDALPVLGIDIPLPKPSIQHDDDAQAIWHTMIHLKEGEGKSSLRNSLNEYFTFEMSALVSVYRALAV